eukprot:12569886-Ditylum_brightwellii.AAC.1
MSQVTNLMASQNLKNSDIAQLQARVEQIKWTCGSSSLTEPSDKSGEIDRPRSPHTEPQKKQQKNSDSVCNTPNVIMGSQNTTIAIGKQKDLCPRRG